VTAQEAEELANQSEEGEGDRQEQQQAQLPKPPALPRQLEKVILNSTPATDSLQTGGAVDDNSVLPAPNHVVLNHLTASAIKSGVLAVGTTTRYKRKVCAACSSDTAIALLTPSLIVLQYVTTVLYKPVRT
jgi:5'-AMP-activated protein kinase beta subunit, interaction domain